LILLITTNPNVLPNHSRMIQQWYNMIQIENKQHVKICTDGKKYMATNCTRINIRSVKRPR